MKILILCDETSWYREHIESLLIEIEKMDKYTSIDLVGDHRSISDDARFDVNIMLSYSRIVAESFLNKNKNNIVVHASKLPEGKGMSPLTWQVLEGKNEIPFTLFEAVPELDAGDIYLQKTLKLEGHELVDELREHQRSFTEELVLEFLREYPNIKGTPQKGQETVYNRRRPSDAQIETNQTIDEVFNLFRVSDNERYPVFFEKNGVKYILKVYKDEQNDQD